MDYQSLKTESRNEKTRDIDKLDSLSIARLINDEDKTVAFAVENALPAVAAGIDLLAAALKNGGRIFYVGAGTSGRLGVLDASECPPTYGVPTAMVVGLIAGGRRAAFESIEDAEDADDSLVSQMQEAGFSSKDICVGISASGSARCVQNALHYAHSLGCGTLCVTNNDNSPLIPLSDVSCVAVVGPEVIEGSTRMKAGTAQKMILNMLSTGAMIKFGRTRGNLMAYMVPSNIKLIDRAERMICTYTNCDRALASQKLRENNNVVADAIDDIMKDKK